jgi:hypothetical protein
MSYLHGNGCLGNKQKHTVCFANCEALRHKAAQRPVVHAATAAEIHALRAVKKRKRFFTCELYTFFTF